MFLIALCDDEARELNKVEGMLASYSRQHEECRFSIQKFLDADGLLSKVKESAYAPDILFMDIYMPGKLGIAAAREIRKMGNRCRIIFLTTSTEHALDAFRVEAEQYLVKPVREDELFPVLGRLLEEVGKERKKYLPLQSGNKVYRIALHDIVFCEAQKKCQCIYMADGTQHLFRMTMAKIYEMVSAYSEFAKVGISYIVNLEHIDSLSARELQMDNGVKIYLPRGSYQPLKERYFDYYCEDDLGGGNWGPYHCI